MKNFKRCTILKDEPHTTSGGTIGSSALDGLLCAKGQYEIANSMTTSWIELYKIKAKSFIDANVWDGENRSGCNGDSASFTPDELQELIDEMIDETFRT